MRSLNYGNPRHDRRYCIPLQELGETVDLIVVLAVWEQGNFTLKLGKPEGAHWYQNLPALDQVRDQQRACRLIVFRNDAFDAESTFAPKVLQ